MTGYAAYPVYPDSPDSRRILKIANQFGRGLHGSQLNSIGNEFALFGFEELPLVFARNMIGRGVWR